MSFPGDVELLCSVVRDKLYRQTTTDEEDAWLFSDVPTGVKEEKRNGIMFTGDKSRLFVNRGKASGKPVEQLKDDPLPTDAIRLYESNDHMGNFFECIKTRKTPVSDLESQHRAVTACHLANISIRLNRKITWDPAKEQIVGDDEANGWLKRDQRAPYVIV